MPLFLPRFSRREGLKEDLLHFFAHFGLGFGGPVTAIELQEDRGVGNGECGLNHDDLEGLPDLVETSSFAQVSVGKKPVGRFDGGARLDHDPDRTEALLGQGQRLFDGTLWVSKKNYATVRAEGQAVPQIFSGKNENLVFQKVLQWEASR